MAGDPTEGAARLSMPPESDLASTLDQQCAGNAGDSTYLKKHVGMQLAKSNFRRFYGINISATFQNKFKEK